MRIKASLAGVLLVGAATASGCGPILSTSFIIDAEAKMAAAEAAEAPTYAPYEYTAAEAYLQKAHEELGYADYGPALDFAAKAADLAERGAARANDEKARHLDGAPPPGQQPSPTPTGGQTGATTPANGEGNTQPSTPPVIIKKVPAGAPGAPQ